MDSSLCIRDIWIYVEFITVVGIVSDVAGVFGYIEVVVVDEIDSGSDGQGVDDY